MADARDDVDEREKNLVSTLSTMGGHAGNFALMRALGWDPDAYWQIRDGLVDSGKLELGQGRGGSVTLVEPSALTGGEGADTGHPAEADLYAPVASVLRADWANDMRFRNHHVEVTARQGRRDTGGTWTRPDVVVAALRVFPHVPGKFFDLVTFELKGFDGIDVTAVYEALAHRRAATQAYVWLHVPESDASQESTQALLGRINDEARRHGVGLIVGADPGDYASWDVQLRAVRVDPDPEFLNEFIAQQLPEAVRDELALWFR